MEKHISYLLYSLIFSVVPCTVFYEGVEDGDEIEE
jgi:hypothetical protein